MYANHWRGCTKYMKSKLLLCNLQLHSGPGYGSWGPQRAPSLRHFLQQITRVRDNPRAPRQSHATT
jgi:hypothetical protein